MVLHIQLAAPHHLQVGEARHQVGGQIKKLRHRVQNAAGPVSSVSSHTFTPSHDCMRRRHRTCLSRPDLRPGP